MKRFLLLFLLLGLVVAAVAGWFLLMPYAGYEREVFVNIPPGTSTQQMATLLTQAGVIQDERQFLAARLIQPGANLQAGEYRFDRPLSALDVYRKIARGDIYYHLLTVPEGSNIFDIAGELERTGLMKRDEFLRTARDPSLIRDLAPRAPSLEGFLFPSTYKVTRQTTPRQLVLQMTREFRNRWSRLGGPDSEVNRLVTIASLVEKETAVPAERPTVASVYHNRLRNGMRLDCDPTVVYAALLDGRYRGTIYKSDLENPHPYNTYRNAGLPPGPIANPGVASLKAALEPAQTSYLFFVAKPDGSGAHVFTETLGQHNVAVQAYRQGLAAGQQ
jgi:UPF0755 protein